MPPHCRRPPGDPPAPSGECISHPNPPLAATGRSEDTGPGPLCTRKRWTATHPGFGLERSEISTSAIRERKGRRNTPDHSAVKARRGGSFTWISRKFSRIPRLHSRLLFRQLLQSGTPSSHLRWRSRQVKHPVRTRLDLPTTGLAGRACLLPLLLPLWLPVLAVPIFSTGGGVTPVSDAHSWLLATKRSFGVPRCLTGGDAPRWAFGLWLLPGVVYGGDGAAFSRCGTAGCNEIPKLWCCWRDCG
jgi:hypothetical protein